MRGKKTERREGKRASIMTSRDVTHQRPGWEKRGETDESEGRDERRRTMRQCHLLLYLTLHPRRSMGKLWDNLFSSLISYILFIYCSNDKRRKWKMCANIWGEVYKRLRFANTHIYIHKTTHVRKNKKINCQMRMKLKWESRVHLFLPLFSSM